MENDRTYTAFAGDRIIASGDVKTMLLRTREYLDRGGTDRILIFEDQTGIQIDFDFRGSSDEVVARLGAHPHFMMARTEDKHTGPGRPKLGVASKEVTLLPRHWEWLESQPNGISAALRKLVEDARRHEPGKERARKAIEAASRFMTAMAGNLPGFEEACRALFARNREKLDREIHDWPADIRKHVERLVDESERLESES